MKILLISTATSGKSESPMAMSHSLQPRDTNLKNPCRGGMSSTASAMAAETAMAPNR